MALHKSVIAGAISIADPNSYSDFFCEGLAGSFHEAVSETDTPKLEGELLAKRMVKVDKLRGQSGGTAYSEHFGDSPDGPNGPWEEIWCEGGPDSCTHTIVFEDETVNPSKPLPTHPGALTAEREVARLIASPAARAQAVGKLRVVQAYMRLRERQYRLPSP